MSNNSLNPFMLTENTSVSNFPGLFLCYEWYFQEKTHSYAQAHEFCTAHRPVELLTGVNVVFWLTGLFIIILNSAVLLGIITTRALYKPLCYCLANLAMSDMMAGTSLLYRTVGYVAHSQAYRFMLLYLNLVVFSQMTSASALSLSSVNSYIAVRHPVYFYNNAGNAKRRAAIVLTCSWLTLSLFSFSPSMGWNCLDMQTFTTMKCFQFYPMAYIIISASIMVFFVGVMLFANTSTFIAIKERERRRLIQVGALAPAVLAGDNHADNRDGRDKPDNATQEVANSNYKRSVHKARTVMIHVAVAFIFWLLPSALVLIVCVFRPDLCGSRSGVTALFCLNSVINPIASLIRTPELRRAIVQKLAGIQQALVAMLRGNSAGRQDEQPGPGNVPSVQGAPADGNKRNKPEEQSEVENRHCETHGTGGAERPSCSRHCEEIDMVETG